MELVVVRTEINRAVGGEDRGGRDAVAREDPHPLLRAVGIQGVDVAVERGEVDGAVARDGGRGVDVPVGGELPLLRAGGVDRIEVAAGGADIDGAVVGDRGRAVCGAGQGEAPLEGRAGAVVGERVERGVVAEVDRAIGRDGRRRDDRGRGRVGPLERARARVQRVELLVARADVDVAVIADGRRGELHRAARGVAPLLRAVGVQRVEAVLRIAAGEDLVGEGRARADVDGAVAAGGRRRQDAAVGRELPGGQAEGQREVAAQGIHVGGVDLEVISRARRGGERHQAAAVDGAGGNSGGGVIVPSDLRECGDGAARVDSGEHVHERAVGKERVGGGGRGDPLVPHGMVGAVGRVAAGRGRVGLAGLRAGVERGGAEAEGGAGDELGVGEVVVVRDHANGEQGDSGGAALARDGDLVGGAGGDADGDQARVLGMDGVVVVGRDRDQGGEAGAGVDRQRGVIGTAGGVERDVGGGRGGPAPPQRVRRGDARNAGLAALGGGVGIVGPDVDIGDAAQHGAAGEVVVERPPVGAGEGGGEVEAAAGLDAADESGDRRHGAEHAVDQLPVGVGGKLRLEQGQRAGDMRRRHRGAAGGEVVVVRVDAARVDRAAGRGQVDRAGAEVGVAREGVGVGGRGDADDVVEAIARGVGVALVHAHGVVARGADKDDAGDAGGVDGVVFGARGGGAAVARVDDVGVIGDGVVDAADGVRDGAAAVGAVEEPQLHQLDGPGNAGDALAVVAGGADDPGHMGAVADLGVVGDGVGLRAVAADEGGAVLAAAVGPEVGHEVLVREADAAVDHGHDHAGGIMGRVPGGHRVDVRTRGAAAGIVRAGIVQRPLVGGEIGVIGRGGGGVDDVVGLDIFIAARGAQAGDRAGHGLRAVDVQHAQVGDLVELPPHMQALGGLGGVHGGAMGDTGLGENHRVAETLGDFLGGERRARRRDRGRAKQQEQGEQSEQWGFHG